MRGASTIADALLLVLRLGVWAFVLVAAARIGGYLTRSRLAGLPHLAWDGACGLAVLAGILVAAGQLPGGFRNVSVLVILAAFAALAWILPAIRPRATIGPPVLKVSGGTWDVVELVLLGCIATVGFLWDRVPAVFFDTLAYHYAQPNLWLVTGRVAPESWSLHSWFPPGMSTLYGIGLAFGGDAAANDANLLMGLILLVMVSSTARSFWGSSAGSLAIMACLGTPIFVHQLGVPAADLGHGAFTFGAIVSLMRSEEGKENDEEDRAWRARAGLLAAGAVLTKYLGYMVPLALGGLWLLARERWRPWAAMRFVAPSLVLSLSWMFANFRAVGNPLAPALAGWWPVRGLAEGGIAAFQADARGGLPTLADVTVLFARLVTGDPETMKLAPSPAWGWLPLLMLPPAFVLMQADRRLRRILALAAVVFLAWFLTYRWERFLVACSTLLALACAGMVAQFWRRGGAGLLLSVALGTLAALNLAQAATTVAAFTGGTSVALGVERADAFIERVWPAARLYARTGELLDPTSDCVLLVGENRHHRLEIPHAAPTVFNEHPLVEILMTPGPPSETSRELRGRGFTHLIVDRAWIRKSAAEYPSLAPLAVRPDLLDGYLRSLGPPLATEAGAALYEVPHE